MDINSSFSPGHSTGASGGVPGYAGFFLSNALSSLRFGSLNREQQEKRAMENLEFREGLNRIRQKYEDEKLSNEIASKRDSLERGRLYQMVEAQSNYEKQWQKVEFNYFIEKCWPLDIDIYTIWKQQRCLVGDGEVIPLKVLFSKAGNLEFNGHYSNLCDKLWKETSSLQGLQVLRSPWQKSNEGGIAQAMNVYYIMQGIPTLLIIPHILNDRIYFETVAWSFGQGKGSRISQTLFSFPYNYKEFKSVQPKIESALLAITGVALDSYRMMEYAVPVQFPSLFSEKTGQYPEIAAFIRRSYEEMRSLANATDFKQICSKEELEKMQQSIRLVL